MLTHDALVGAWRLLRCDAPLEIEPGTQMRFADDATLEYGIPTASGTLSITLQWRLDGATLITAFLDGSNQTSVAASIGAADVLTFDFGGPRAWYVRVS